MTESQTETKTTEEAEEPVDDHLEDVEDGCGCTEIWEHLSEGRESGDD